jgi:hypothetical protein
MPVRHRFALGPTEHSLRTLGRMPPHVAIAAGAWRKSHPSRKCEFQADNTMGRAAIRISLGQLFQHRFENVNSLKAILSSKQIPDIFIFHGEADEIIQIIPLEMGRVPCAIGSESNQIRRGTGTRRPSAVPA